MMSADVAAENIAGAAMPACVSISEDGPLDGVRSIASLMPLAAAYAGIDVEAAAVAAGFVAAPAEGRDGMIGMAAARAHLA